MQFDREKLKEAVLYIAEKCPAENLGAVKLHKVLYFADMLRYVDTGTPFVGATYKKRPKGPTCEQLLSVTNELRNQKDLSVKIVDYFGYEKREYNPLRKAQKDRFNADEIELLDELIDFVCRDHTAKTISDFSHQLPWELVEFGDEIDYNSAFLLFPDEVSEEALAWAEHEASKVEAERSKKDPVDCRNAADFRRRVLAACGR